MGFWSRLFTCPGCDATAKRCADLEARLFAEIDSNRLREDALMTTALQSAGVVAGARVYRLPLAPPSTTGNEVDEELERSPTYDAQLEAQIRAVADDMIEAGRKIGNEYTPEAQMLLLEKIRENPDEYLR